MKTFDPAQFKKFSVAMKASATEAEIFLYDQIGTSFWGDGVSAKQFAEQFRAAAATKPQCIVLHINSPGGDVFDASAIYDLVKASAIPVDVVVDGLAASAAFTVAMAGRKITIGEAGLMMMHNAKGMAFGSAKEMSQTADTLDKISNQMAEIYAKRCGMAVDEIKALMDAETWLTAQECVDKGCADEIATEPDEDDKAAQVGATFDLSKYRNVPENLKVRIAALATIKASAGKPVEIKAAKPAEVKKMETTTTAASAAATEVRVPYGPTAAAIMQLGRDYKVDVTEMLNQEAPLAQAKEVIADLVIARAKDKSNTSGLAAPTVDNLSDKERRDYSICRAIRALAGDREVDATLEREVSASIAKNIGKTTSGIFIPTQMAPFRPQMAGLDTKTNAAGKYTVATEVRDLIELLRNKARVIQLGSTVLSGLQGNLQFPTQATAGTLVWTGENPGSDVTAGDITFGARTMSPKTAQATTSFSRQLLAQSTVDAEALVREDLAKIHALGVDAAAINGLGSSNQPLGILKTSGIGSALAGNGTNGGVPTYGCICDLETSIAAANADEDGMRFLTTPGMRGKLKKVGKLDSTYASIPLWDQWGNAPGVGDLIGYQAFVSNQVPSTLTKGSDNGTCHAIIFGYWPSVVIGEWGVIELVVDPYSLKKQGMIEVTSFQMVDVMLRQPAQMAAIQDAKTA
jgi:HK97 family phage major capsid protein